MTSPTTRRRTPAIASNGFISGRSPGIRYPGRGRTWDRRGCAIDDHRVFRAFLMAAKSGLRNSFHSGDDDQGVGAGQGGHGAFRVVEAGTRRRRCAGFRASPPGRRRSPSRRRRTGRRSAPARGFAHVVGIGFEGQAPKCKMPAFEIAEAGLDFLGQNVFCASLASSTAVSRE